ncbi:hypothetical protein [Puia dinghuensis]|uniref:Uncharacterized protein n=1 Tax=Puia dinghuensis TaxID=1792502 RepID=A0A8J2UFJ6_9BACT|nr:hypothetical protein [Puia dinghuensis]GGB11169.1 hypothetical protein GCM10011511_38440 [Puia dinghuensis]
MPKELYFDISSEDSGGSLYRIIDDRGEAAFLYNHSTIDPGTDEVTVFDTWYVSFEAFWKMLTRDPEWYYRHPLFVHPEQREFVREQLKGVDWTVHPDKKWRESHQRQWKKVLSDPEEYYRS